jgi:hypothetical protein
VKSAQACAWQSLVALLSKESVKKTDPASRTGSATGLAQQYALAIGQLPNTVLVALDEGLASQSAGLGARHKLRGADAVYLATAALFAAEHVTLDREQLERGSSIVQALTPAGFVSTIKQ